METTIHSKTKKKKSTPSRVIDKEDSPQSRVLGELRWRSECSQDQTFFFVLFLCFIGSMYVFYKQYSKIQRLHVFSYDRSRSFLSSIVYVLYVIQTSFSACFRFSILKIKVSNLWNCINLKPLFIFIIHLHWNRWWNFVFHLSNQFWFFNSYFSYCKRNIFSLNETFSVPTFAIQWMCQVDL